MDTCSFPGITHRHHPPRETWTYIVLCGQLWGWGLISGMKSEESHTVRVMECSSATSAQWEVAHIKKKNCLCQEGRLWQHTSCYCIRMSEWQRNDRMKRHESQTQRVWKDWSWVKIRGGKCQIWEEDWMEGKSLLMTNQPCDAVQGPDWTNNGCNRSHFSG